MSHTHGLANIRKAFANRQYRTYQAGRFFSLVTIWMYRVAVGWTVWELTHSAAWLGVFGFLDQAPALLVMPFAGAQADRLDCLKYLRVTQSLMLVQAMGLGFLVAFDLVNIWILAGFTLAYGAVNAAQQPASQAIVPNILHKDELTAAYGLNSLTFNVSRLIGPMIAGPVIHAWGTAPAFFCNAVGAAAFSLCLASMRTHGTFGRRQGSRSSHMLNDIREGLAYALRHPGIGPTMAMLSSLSLFPFAIDQLMPSLADGVYQAGANGLAWMTSIMGLGAMTMAFHVAQRGAITGLTRYVVRSVLVMGIAYIGLALSGSIWMALVFIFVIGFCTSAARVGSMTLLQYSVDADMRGRVASFYALINHIGPATGSLLIGALGDRFGIPQMMGVTGLVTLGVWAWVVLRQGRIAAALELEPRSPDSPAEPSGETARRERAAE